MDAIKQYIDFYKANAKEIDARSAAPLNALRREALENLEHPDPERIKEEYSNYDLGKTLSPDYGINIARVAPTAAPAEAFHCGVPVVAGNIFLQINDSLRLTDTSYRELPEGVEVGSLKEFAEKDPETIARYYGKAADPTNIAAALDTLLAQDGFFLHLRRGTRLPRPLQLLNILAATMPTMAVRRVLIVAEENTEATILVCNHTQTPGLPLFDLQTVEIFAGRDSQLDYYELEESSPETCRLSTLFLNQEENSRVILDGMTLCNGRSRNEYFCRLKGEHASLRLLGMGIEDGEQSVSTFTRIDHSVPRCKSDELFKFSVSDKACADFTGRIYVAPGAVGTEAYQANRNLVGSSESKVTSKPELEIYNDDVKCSHGCAVGQLDPMQLFYMRTRGLDEKEATLLLKQAFMADVIDGVAIPALRERLRLLVEQRFSGIAAACAGCRLKN